MKTLFLHIGHGKTGSSYIQSCLSASSVQLRQKGYAYEGCSKRASRGHISSGNFIWFRNNFDRFVDHDVDHHIVSGEAFFNRWKKDEFPDKAYHFIEANKIERVKILLFTRDPLEHAESVFQQLVKRAGYCEGIEGVIKDYSIINRVLFYLKNGFNLSNETLVVKNYSRHKDSILDCVKEWLEIDMDLEQPEKTQRVNRSLTSFELSFQRLLNEQFGRCGFMLSDPLCNLLPEIPNERFYPPEDIQSEFFEGISDVVEKANSLLPESEHYRMELEGVNSKSDHLCTEEQLEVILSSLSEYISKDDEGKPIKVC